MTIKPLTEETADDFRQLIVARFSAADAALVDAMLANPARRQHPESGALAYDADGRVLYVQGNVPRRAFWENEPVTIGSLTAMAARHGSPRDAFPAFLHHAICTPDTQLIFTNTANPRSALRVKAAANGVDGPASFAAVRLRALRPTPAPLRQKLNGLLVRLHLRNESFSVPQIEESFGACRRLLTIDAPLFDAFWSAYLATNTGLVTSRTAEELDWMFGAHMASGDVVALGLFEGAALTGYVFLRRADVRSLCWQVMDLIALENAPARLQSLLEASAAFLLRRTPATALRITGFPLFIQSLLRDFFPEEIPLGFNRCCWATPNVHAPFAHWMTAQDGWFGCPYDGDMCIC